MRFYPDVYAVEGLETPVPNLMLAMTLARSLLARGQGTDRFEDSMADFRRVVILGRLLRQDDVVVMSDLVGLAVIRIGAEAIYDRARKDGRGDLALAGDDAPAHTADEYGQVTEIKPEGGSDE